MFHGWRRGIVALRRRDRRSSIPDAILPYFDRWGSGGRSTKSLFCLGAEAAYLFVVPGPQCFSGRDLKQAASHVVLNLMAEAANGRSEAASGKRQASNKFSIAARSSLRHASREILRHSIHALLAGQSPPGSPSPARNRLTARHLNWSAADTRYRPVGLSGCYRPRRAPLSILWTTSYLNWLCFELILVGSDTSCADFGTGGIFLQHIAAGHTKQTFWPARLTAASSDSCPGLLAGLSPKANCLSRHHQAQL